MPASYNYIKTLLFGFSGWDRYILTEDAVLQDFLEAIIQRHCSKVFYRYKIIYIGGGSQVSDLLRRNEVEGFLSEAENVIAILDGDRAGQGYAAHPRIHFLPIESVEAALFQYYREGDFPYRYPNPKQFTGPKDLFNALQSVGVMSRTQIHSYLLQRNEESLAPLAATLNRFLSRPQ